MLQCRLHHLCRPHGATPAARPAHARPARRGAALHRRRGAACARSAAAHAHAAQDVKAISLADYELVVVGSGNGCCAFLAKWLEATEHGRALVIEEGSSFLETSHMTHQTNWTKSYADGPIYRLHAATTGNARGAGNRPLICGRACTQGGGGSINYTMIHESDGWLADRLGADGRFDADYWRALKAELGARFQRSNPERTPVAEALHAALSTADAAAGGFAFEDVPNQAPWIPSYVDSGPTPVGGPGSLYTFTTQFNDAGQRTASGVSLVAPGGRDWSRTRRIDVWHNTRVEQLLWGEHEQRDGGPLPCTGLLLQRISPTTGSTGFVRVDLPAAPATTVVLAAGAGSPRLLLPHRELLRNAGLGARVNDHILLPLGIYTLKPGVEVSPKDQYINLFASREVAVTVAGDGSQARSVIATYDFFAGPLGELAFALAHLFISVWPNHCKRCFIERPELFQIVKQFNIAFEGFMEPQRPASSSEQQRAPPATRVVLHCFANAPDGSRTGAASASPDGVVATAVIPTLMSKLEAVGNKPCGLLRCLLGFFGGLIYEADAVRVAEFVNRYADGRLLTQQHLSGGCVLGLAADDGRQDPRRTGLVHGTANVVVADLSAAPLPRVSPQMTAYLVGYHVATQRYGGGGAAAAAPSAA